MGLRSIVPSEMSPTRTWIAAVVAFTLLAGAVAMPAAATGADGGDAGSADRAGPPADLPGPVPAFVERILGAIRGFVGSVTVVAGQVG
jgi:hypothetical protein